MLKPQGGTIGEAALIALMEQDPVRKVTLTHELARRWRAADLPRAAAASVAPRIEIPGRPERPLLVTPDSVPRRSPASREGHAALLHAIAHIEFNAINLALDCVFRFPEMPDAFVNDWVRIADEEAGHFELLARRLADLDHAYGDFTAHNGLWEMALKSDHDLLVRMALVPRLLEARGLDATPPIVARLEAAGDAATVAVLAIILRDEIGHVAIGDRWFRTVCAERGLEPEAEYRRLIACFAVAPPRPPFNREARIQAGFSAQELDQLEADARRPLRG